MKTLQGEKPKCDFPDFDLTNKNKRKKERRKNKPKKIFSDDEDIDPDIARENKVAMYNTKMIQVVKLWKDRLALIDPTLFREDRLEKMESSEKNIYMNNVYYFWYHHKDPKGKNKTYAMRHLLSHCFAEIYGMTIREFKW